MSLDKSSPENEKFGKILNQAYIKRGIFIFIGITLIAFTCLFLFSNTGDVLKALKEIKLQYVGLAFLMAFFDWWIGGMRNHIFVRETNPGISQRVCFDANLANIFIGAVTPSQTGGGPAHLYMLWRGGVKLTDGIAVSVVNYISTILFFILSTGIAIYHLQSIIPNDHISLLIKSGFAIFTTGFIIVLISLLAPERMGKVLIWIGKKLKAFFPNKFKNLDSKSENLAAELQNYHKTIMFFLINNPLLLPLSFIITCIMYFNKYALAFVLLLGLGIEADFWTVIEIQAIIFFMLYHAPSPGASGFAELSIAGLMAHIIIDSKLATFTILHRSFLLLLGALVGAFIMLKELKKHNKEQNSIAELHK